MAEHLEENTILGYAGNKLATAERDRVEQHIDECPECRQALAIFVGRSSTPFAAEITARPGGKEAENLSSGMPEPGERLADRFTIGNQLGRGGMGHVFQATDDDLGIQVAVKILRPEIAIDEERIRHLRREILAGRKIAHPNVCRVFDLGRTEKLHFITMELVVGETLAERIKQGPMQPAKVVSILRQLLSALESAHNEGIVHRDLKPANVMLDAGDKVKVMDFGLARDLAGEHSLKGHVGTPAYWSPEQASGEAAGPPADIHAVGVIAYLLLTGEQSTRKLRKRLAQVPFRLRTWIERCIEEEPGDRFADAKTALAALPDPHELRRRRKLALAAGAVAGALGIGGGVWLATRDGEGHPGVPQPVTAPTPQARDAGEPAVDAAAPVQPPIDAATIVRRPRVDAGVVTGDAALRATPPPDASLLYEP